MGELKIKISNKAEEIFRRLAMQKFGYSKGSISQAAQEAIEEWANEKEEKSIVNFEKFRGILKNKKTSVELQHEAWNDVRRKYAIRR